MENSTSCAFSDFAFANAAYVSDHKHEAIQATACAFYLDTRSTAQIKQAILCGQAVERY